ncbi:MAG: iron-sulfur cluster assembly accessory protein [Xanthomonadales bacterium]|nr:iron-sulfur cluster assembly accessory protein [Xanthomonadales bacterium]
MGIQLSESAAERVGGFLHENPAAVGLRFGVRRTGCSGFAYVVELAERVEPNDIAFESHGIRVLVDRDCLASVDGTEIDYARQGFNAQFVFRNPNVAAQCGCGESFTTA